MASTLQLPRSADLSKRIVELDGLRGLAILLTIIWHYLARMLQVKAGTPAAYAVATLGLTWTGVDLFFVLSGFLIGGILLAAKDSRHYYTTFYARRFYRILPLYGVWYALYCFGRHVGSLSRINWWNGIFGHDIHWWSYAVFTQNLEMAARQNWGGSWASVTWSLAVEEQFYLLLPFVIRNLSSKALLKTVAAAIFCAPFFRLLFYFNNNTHLGPYVILPCRADSLGVGVLIAILVRRPQVWEYLVARRKWLSVIFLALGLGIALLTAWHSDLVLASFGYTWIAAFYGVLLLLVVVEPRPIEKAVFGNKALVLLGTISYGLYLFHEGTNNLVHGVLFGKESVIGSAAEALVTLACLVLVILAAWLSWRYFEEPLLRRARRQFRYRTV